MYVKVKKRTWGANDEKSAWIVDYKDGEGRRRLETFEKKKIADTRADEIKGELRGGVHVPRRESVTLQEAADLWLHSREHGDADSPAVEPATLRVYRHHCRDYILPKLGNIKLSDLTTPQVRAFVTKLIAEHNRTRGRKVVTTLKSILTYAVDNGLATRNVASAVKVAKDERSDATAEINFEKVPTPAEIRAMVAKLDELAGANRSWAGRRALMRTAIATGMRASELRGLTWENVDLKRSVIKVRQRADENGIIGPPKSKYGRRDIIIDPALVALLKEWKLACPPSRLKLVFPNQAGNIESLGNIHNRIWRPLLKACRLPLYRFHDLRHHRASALVAAGANPREVQEELGHHSAAFTMTAYAKLFKDDDTARRERATRIAAGLYD